MKRLQPFVLFGLLVASLVLMAPDAASAKTIRKQTYQDMVWLRMKEKWLLPPVSLRSNFTEDRLDQQRRLRPFLGGNVAQAVKAVEFNFQNTPFGPDVLVSKDQARALVQLGMLSHMGHFAVLDSDDSNIKAGALDVINQLADIADHFKLGALRSQYQRLASEVGDPRYAGGPGPTVQKYDATVAALYDVVTASYGIDGHWYFMFGGASAGLFAISTPGNALEPVYFVEVLDDLYHLRPTLTPDYVARIDLKWTELSRPGDNWAYAAQSWNTVRYYLRGEERYVNPYAWQEPLNQWHRGSEREEQWWW